MILFPLMRCKYKILRKIGVNISRQIYIYTVIQKCLFCLTTRYVFKIAKMCFYYFSYKYVHCEYLNKRLLFNVIQDRIQTKYRGIL